MTKVLTRQLIGHEDLALGYGKVTQLRGGQSINLQQVELPFIFRSVDEIKALNYAKYEHVSLYTVGRLIAYYFDSVSYAIADDDNVLLPDSILITQAGRYIKAVYSEIAVLDTVIASASDETTPIVVDTKLTTFRAPYPLVLSYVRISLTEAPQGAELIVDVLIGGVSIFSVPLHIDAGHKTSVTSATQSVLSVINIVDDTEFTVSVLQVGATEAGKGLKVAVTGAKGPL